MNIIGPDGRTYFIGLHDDVYRPAEDTLLLARAVHAHVRSGDRFLEVGGGAGLVSLVAARAGARVTLTDLNEHAVELAKHNARENGLAITTLTTDLLAGVAGPVDVVAFNPPYLPTTPDEYVSGPLNLAFDGGLDGNATVLRFASQVTNLRPLPRLVLVVHSTLSDPVPLDTVMARAGFVMQEVDQEDLAYERLTVRGYRPRPD